MLIIGGVVPSRRDEVQPSAWGRNQGHFYAINDFVCVSKHLVVLHRGEMKRNPEKMMFFVLWYIFSERSRAIRRGCCFLMIGFRDWYSELGLYRLAVDCLLLKITCNSPLNTQKCNLNLWNLISYMLVITSGAWNWCANTHAIASCIKKFSTPHKFNQQLLSSIAALCPPTINPMHCSTMYCYSSEHHRIAWLRILLLFPVRHSEDDPKW